MTTTPHSASDDPIRDERFRLGIEGAGIGIWDLDLSTHKLLWSKTTRKLFGVPNELPLTYELFLSLLEPRDREPTDQVRNHSNSTLWKASGACICGECPRSGNSTRRTLGMRLAASLPSFA